MKNVSNVTWMSMISIPVALLVFALKYLAYYLTGSVALYSDALESIVNVIAAMGAWWAIRLSMKPADINHQFGHHKAEYFSAVFEGVLIILAAILIIHQAWAAIDAPRMLEQSRLGLTINMIAAGINALWALLLIRNGTKHRSPALKADGQHLMTDVITSVGVLIGLVTAVVSGWAILDPLLAIVVGVHILWQGWKVINTSIQGLMDVGAEIEETMRIRDVISAHAGGAIEAHDLRTRLAGRVTFIEFHLVVPSAMSVGQAHAICDRIEDALKAEIDSARVVIHVEPENEAKLPPGTTAVPFA